MAKATDCKSVIYRFDSDRNLFFISWAKYFVICPEFSQRQARRRTKRGKNRVERGVHGVLPLVAPYRERFGSMIIRSTVRKHLTALGMCTTQSVFINLRDSRNHNRRFNVESGSV